MLSSAACSFVARAWLVEQSGAMPRRPVLGVFFFDSKDRSFSNPLQVASAPARSQPASNLQTICPSATTDYAPVVQIRRRALQHHAVAGKKPDKVFTHLPRDVRQHLVARLQLNPKHGVRQRLHHRAFESYWLFIRHLFLFVLFTELRTLLLIQILQELLGLSALFGLVISLAVRKSGFYFFHFLHILLDCLLVRCLVGHEFVDVAIL
jgi:hypothetical protein